MYIQAVFFLVMVVTVSKAGANPINDADVSIGNEKGREENRNDENQGGYLLKGEFLVVQNTE